MTRSVLLEIALVITLVVVGFLCFTQFAMVPLGNSTRITPPAADTETAGSEAGGPTTQAVRRTLVAKQLPGGVSTAAATNVLRVVLEGIGKDRFHPTLPRFVTVHAHKMTEVIVELRRK